jgi:hypothetical protein
MARRPDTLSGLFRPRSLSLSRRVDGDFHHCQGADQPGRDGAGDVPQQSKGQESGIHHGFGLASKH